MTSIYQLCKLGSQADDVRVLVLRPGKGDEGIACDLIVQQLGENANYTALSYSWAKSDEGVGVDASNKITLRAGKGQEYSHLIKDNLYDFLKEVRDPNTAITLWTDSLCIDQGDNDDKAANVLMMDRVYRSATQTIVWLGTEADDSSLAMETVRHFRPSDFDGNLDPCHRKWLAVRKLLRRRWWQRLWVLQEVLLSRCIVVRCGPATAPFSKFVEMRVEEAKNETRHVRQFDGLRLFGAGVPLGKYLTNWEHDRAILLDEQVDDQGRTWPRGTGMAMSTWLSWTMKFECSEPLDRVYALLGIIDPRERARITVEYPEKGESQDATVSRIRMLYTRAAAYGFIFYGFEKLHSGFVQDRVLDIPSWIPDWSQSEEHISFFDWPRSGDGRSKLKNHGFWDKYTISGPRYMWLDDETGCLFDIVDPDGKRELRVLGVIEEGNEKGKHELRVLAVIVDTTTFRSKNPCIPMYGGDVHGEYNEVRNDRLKKTIGMSHEWENYTKSIRPIPYGNESGRYDAFWRTLVADRTFDWQQQPSADWRAQFEVWMGDRNAIQDARPVDRIDQMFDFYPPAVTRCMSRSFIVTKKGYFGLAPGRCQEGDEVCLLKGGTTPFVIRAAGNRKVMVKVDGKEKEEELTQRLYTFIGESYIHGIMNGEPLEDNTTVAGELWLI